MRHPFLDQGNFDAQYRSLDCRSMEFVSLEFDQCKFNRCNFREADLKGCKFSNCSFVDCDFSLSKFNDCSFLEVSFKNCQLIGINWMNTSLGKKNYLKPVDFFKCALNYSTFIGSQLKAVHLTGCIAHSVDFSDADLSEADCTGTDFSGSRFHQTNLTGANFIGAIHYSISVTDNIVKKAKFSLPEAMTLLDGLDIELSDERYHQLNE